MEQIHIRQLYKIYFKIQPLFLNIINLNKKKIANVISEHVKNIPLNPCGKELPLIS